MTLFILHATLTTLIISCLISTAPVSLGVTVLFIALFSSITIATILTSWYGLIIFIIYVGGMLVIFAYFSALQPNQHVTNWMWWATIPIVLISSGLTYRHAPFIINITSASIQPLYNYQNILILIFLALLLFLALIAIVKTSHAREGPLRPFYPKYV